MNVRLVGLALSVPGDTPIPESEKSIAEADPLMVSPRVPLSGPAVVGVNTTEKVALWFGANVSGRVSPVVL